MSDSDGSHHFAASRRWPLVVLLAVALACGEEDRKALVFPAAPVVLVSIDTLRSDRLPVYGYQAGRTPAIDELRRDGVLVERAYAHVPLTLPSHASLLGGLLPTEHGVRDNLGYRVRSEHLLLPALLHDRGYATGAAVSSFVLRSETGISAHFELWSEPPSEEVERTGEGALAAVLPWLHRVAAQRFFLFLHLYEPHTPYTPPLDLAAAFDSPYDAEVAAADRVVGRLLTQLRELGAYDRCLILLLSDHGEGLGDHGEQEHGVFLYREALQVPLIVKLPRSRRAGETITAPVQLVDVAPTILALLGHDVPESLPGKSLFHLDEAAARDRALYAETFYPRLHFGWSELRSVIAGRHHFVDAPEPELYDLVTDPGERDDLVEERRDVARRLSRLLQDLPVALSEPGDESSVTRRRLAALGYVGSVAHGSGAPPDPKTQVPVLAGLEAAMSRLAHGDVEGAIPPLRELVAARPDLVAAWKQLAWALERSGRLEAALEAQQRVLELTDSGRESLDLARILVELGKHEDALAALEKARRQGASEPALDRRVALALGRQGRLPAARRLLEPLADRGDPEAMVALGTVLSESGRAEVALPLLERAVTLQPADALTHETLGLALLRMARGREAEKSLRRAVELDPAAANAWNLLGVSLLRGSGDVEGALDAWRRALELDAERWDVLFNLGAVAAEHGRHELARSSLERFVGEAPAGVGASDIERARSLLRALEEGTERPSSGGAPE